MNDEGIHCDCCLFEDGCVALLNKHLWRKESLACPESRNAAAPQKHEARAFRVEFQAYCTRQSRNQPTDARCCFF